MTREYDWLAAVERDAARVPGELLAITLQAAQNGGRIWPPSDGRHAPGEVDPREFAALAAAVRAAGFEPGQRDLDPGDPDSTHLGLTLLNGTGDAGHVDLYQNVADVPWLSRELLVTTGLSPVSALRVALHEFGHALKRGALTVEDIMVFGWITGLFGEDRHEEAEVQLAADAVMARLGHGYGRYGPSFIANKLMSKPDGELTAAAAELAADIWSRLQSATA